MKAEILCVGTELLLGDIVNTNAAFIAKELAGLGIDLFYQSVVGDNPERLRSSLELAFSRADVVVMTGGLGPTYDDLTKETVADFFSLPMVMDEKSLQSIEQFFKKFGREMTENNKKQALMPRGATVFENNWGTAPGLAVNQDGKIAILLPGPPSEMTPMFEHRVVPYLMQFSDKVLVSRNIRLFGIGESNLESILADMMKTAKNPTIAPYAKTGEVSLRVTAAAETKQQGLDMIAPVIEQIRGVVGEFIYGIDVPSIQDALVKQLQAKGLKIAVAESCTGGLVSQMITQISGASEVFDCGICSYANEIKHSVLGVQDATLQKYGAVSQQTALEMAAGVCKLAHADIGISTTGIAGPGGGTPEKPVGTVFVGVYTKQKQYARQLQLSFRHADDERKNIRYRSAQNALYEALKLANEW